MELKLDDGYDDDDRQGQKMPRVCVRTAHYCDHFSW